MNEREHEKGVRNMLKNAIKHFILITKHKWLVGKLCIKAGQPFRGLMHDWSKYSIIEFWESVRYYDGTRSPIKGCLEQKRYSEAWLHHKGRNKHHYEYWYDPKAPEKTPVIPYPYAIEMVCDRVAAGIVYEGKNFKQDEPLRFLEKEQKDGAISPFINEKTEKFLMKVFTQMSENGIEETLKAKKLKEWYQECCMK